ncbi:uncharacterized protein CIMG_00189 [Coccidioides immitis RS]|uniref:LIM zinc-binding domain-containing protein n=1 Tax=Coccidioides immitis (strain RS) TaxID=246410 RepID=J3KGG7_COCIM|nr:uncharacterized protein CIMG_00189 [Coccidioides immitis RS]EAS34835.3 hypothetical protein CIMG_00189 [Coccidioides immitis RS]
MAGDLDDFLPKIKCSSCQAEVELSAMGEHVCQKEDKRTQHRSAYTVIHFHGLPYFVTLETNPLTLLRVALPPPPAPQAEANYGDGRPSTELDNLDGPLAKVGRMAPPPPIDPHAANRPFLRLLVPTSPTSGGIKSASPLSFSPKSPMRQPQRSQTSPLPNIPSPERANIDSVIPPFPGPDPRASTKSRSRARTLVKGERVQSPLVTSPSEIANNGLDFRLNQSTSTPVHEDDDDDDDHERRRRRSRANRHKREVSVDSKSLYRMSMASSRYGDSISRSSTPGFPNTASLRGHPNYLDEIPPLPAFPIKSYTPTPFIAEPEPYQFPNTEEFENDRIATTPPRSSGLSTGLPGFELGFPIDGEPPKPQDRHSHAARLSEGSRGSVPLEVKRPDSQRGPGQDVDFPAYSVQEDFSVSNFARGLGLGDPYHTTNDSTSSSDSSPSDAATTVSYSTQPSEPPSAELKPPPSPYKYDLDSPTDPLFQQGRFECTPPKYERFGELESEPKPEERRGEVRSVRSRRPSQPNQRPTKTDSPPPTPAPPKSPGQPRRVRCRGCGEIIVGKSVSSADGRLTGRWHKACFVCYTCHSPFQTADFYVLDNNPFCAQHYHELNGSLCASCGQGIEGPCLQTEEIVRDEKSGTERRQIFHPDCFRCKMCRIVLREDYLEWNGDVYCDRDGRRAAAIAYSPPSPGFPPGPGPGPGAGFGSGPGRGRSPGPGYNGPPPPGYGRRPSYNSPLPGAPRGGSGPGPGRGRGQGPGRGYPIPPNRGPGGPPAMPKIYPPSRSGSGRSKQPPPMGNSLNLPGPRKFPERRKTKLMML